MDRPDQHVERDTTASGRLRRILVAVSLAMFLVQLDFFALNLALPQMAHDLGVTTTDMQWAISGYMLAVGALMIPAGRIGDILGRKRILLVGVALFGLTSLAAGLSSSAGMVIAFRVLQGAGAAMSFPVGIAALTNAFPADRRQAAIGNAYGIAAVGTAVGPFVGGALSEVSWRWVLIFNVPLAVAALILALTSMEESRDASAPRTIDLRGVAAVALGIGALTFAVDRGSTWGWTSAATLGTFAAGALMLIAFVAVERRVRFPLVELSLFRNTPYVVITLAGMVSNIAFCVTTFAVTIYLQQVRGLSPIEAGIVFLAPSLTLAVMGPVSGHIGERFRPIGPMATAIGAGSIGLLVLSGAHAWGVFVPAFAVFGAGLGFGWSFVSVATQSVVKPERAGEASGVTLTIVVAVAGLCVATAATVLEVLQAGGATAGEANEELLRWTALGALTVSAALFAFQWLGTAGAHAEAEAPA
jgi:EmrB/QacA subfamily drug resistance transporter